MFKEALVFWGSFLYSSCIGRLPRHREKKDLERGEEVSGKLEGDRDLEPNQTTAQKAWASHYSVYGDHS
jgi:hypothetical protein